MPGPPGLPPRAFPSPGRADGATWSIRLGGAMTIEQRQQAYFAAGPPCDDSNYLCGWASGGRVHLEASRSLTLTPKEARDAARSQLFAAARAEEHARWLTGR